MKVKQQLKKMLRSALIFAMVFALCGTTLAKAYATYFPVIVEHVWLDNHNSFGPGGKEEEPAEGETPAENEEQPAEDETPAENEEQPAEDTIVSGPRDAVGSLEVTFTGESHDISQNTWNTRFQGGDLSDPDTIIKYGREEYSQNGSADGKINGKYDAVVKMDSSSTVEEVAEGLAQQISECSETDITEEQVAVVAEVMAEALQNENNEKVPGPGDVWQQYAPSATNYGYGSDWADYYTLTKAELTEKSKNALAAQGYETTLTITIVTGSTNLDGGDCTYVSTDGENWTNADTKESVDADTVFKMNSIRSCTYSFTHYRAASYGPTDPETPPEIPENPPVIPENPPVIPENPPVIPENPPETPENPSEELEEPDVPLAEPEIPEEEPPVEEPPEEVELEEPDVPLADIPETGDISGLWYGAALMAAAGLVILLAQERRNKKTA